MSNANLCFRFRKINGKDPIDSEETNKTADSTFKPKSLRNKVYHDKLLQEQPQAEAEEPVVKDINPKEAARQARRKAILNNSTAGEVFKVKLKPTVINDRSSFNSNSNGATKRRRKYVVKAKVDKPNVCFFWFE